MNPNDSENIQSASGDLLSADGTLLARAPKVRRSRQKRWLKPLLAALCLFMAAAVGFSAAVILLPLLKSQPGQSGLSSGQISSGNPSAPSAESAVSSPILNPDSEVRGVWIATVTNINFPSKKGLSVKELKAELDDIIATCEAANLNAIYFQVRPSSDALYDSDIFPVSEYLTGTQGSSLPDGFDPLAYLLEQAHAKNIRVHAWVNPLRVTVGSQSSPKTDVTALSKNHPARLNPDWTIAYADGRLYYDCGLPEVRELVADGVREIVEKYDVDGIIFDDYFYPYPVYTTVNGKNVLASFNDDASYKKYGGKLDRDDWRRANVNAMIEACYNAIKEVDSDCQFGVAPFGIWQNDDGTNGGSDTSGLESYSSIYCDPTAWVEGGYVDYISPQLYWRFTTTAARYDVLVRWWNTLLDGTGVDLIVSHGVYNYDSWTNPENELREQVEYARAELTYKGSILYGYAALKANSHGLLDETKEVFSQEIIYTDITSNGRDLVLSIPYSGSYIDGEGSFLIGTSDPAQPLTIDGQKVGRTKSGYFSLYLDLKKGKNTFTLEHKGKTTEYVLNRGTQPTTSTSTSYTKMEKYEITSVTPSYRWAGSTSTLAVSVTAPSGSSVVAELAGTKVTLKPTINPPANSTYMREVYTGSIPLPSAKAGEVKELGTIKFTAKRGTHTATAESADIRVLGSGAVIPVEITANDTEMKVQPNSWYYDDYTPQSAGMRDNAVSLSSGQYKLRCGGYVSEQYVQELEGDAIGIAKLSAAKVSSDTAATYIRFTVDENIPLNCYVENGEFCVTLYNMDTSAAPEMQLADTPLFTSVRGEKSAKANAYKYFFQLVDIENFYGFDYYYEDGQLVVELINPQPLSDERLASDTPLLGKTIILDAGHGGPNPGALGPLGSAEGAMNESDFNLEIVMAACDKLTALGAQVVLTRDRETEIDVPVLDRVAQLIEVDPDLCISVHQNSMPYTTDITKIRGLVGLYWSDSGYMLTSVMGETMSAALNKLDRSPTQQRLAMVRNPKFPSTLVEVCFITSVEEYERMMQPDAIETIAQSLADGVLNYYEAQRKYVQ